jgi:hypothetical protein
MFAALYSRLRFILVCVADIRPAGRSSITKNGPYRAAALDEETDTIKWCYDYELSVDVQ